MSHDASLLDILKEKGLITLVSCYKKLTLLLDLQTLDLYSASKEHLSNIKIDYNKTNENILILLGRIYDVPILLEFKSTKKAFLHFGTLSPEGMTVS